MHDDSNMDHGSAPRGPFLIVSGLRILYRYSPVEGKYRGRRATSYPITTVQISRMEIIK